MPMPVSDTRRAAHLPGGQFVTARPRSAAMSPSSKRAFAGDRASIGRVLDGVVHQIADDLAQLVVVATAASDVLLPRGARSGLFCAANGDCFSTSSRASWARSTVSRSRGDAPTLDMRKLEHVDHEIIQDLRLLPKVPDQLASLFVWQAVVGHVEVAADEGDD